MDENPVADRDVALDNFVRTLRRSRLSVLFVMVAWTLFGGLSLGLFTYQLQIQDELGLPFYQKPGGLKHLAGHLLRAVVGFLIALRTWQYHRSIPAEAACETENLAEVGESLRSFWNTMALAILVMGIYSLWVVWNPVNFLEAWQRQAEAKADRPAREAVLDPVRIEFRIAEDEQTTADPRRREELTEATIEGTSDVVYLHSEVILSNSDISRAGAMKDENGSPAISILIAPQAQFRLQNATRKNRDKRLAILVNGQVIMAPIIRWDISESAMISGRLTQEEVDRIVESLNSQPQ